MATRKIKYRPTGIFRRFIVPQLRLADYLYVGGVAIGDVDIAGENLVMTSPDRQGFVARYNADKTPNWLARVTGSNQVNMCGVPMVNSKDGSVIAAFELNIDFGDTPSITFFNEDDTVGQTINTDFETPASSKTWNDLFLCRWDASGNVTHTKHLAKLNTPGSSTALYRVYLVGARIDTDADELVVCVQPYANPYDPTQSYASVTICPADGGPLIQLYAPNLSTNDDDRANMRPHYYRLNLSDLSFKSSDFVAMYHNDLGGTGFYLPEFAYLGPYSDLMGGYHPNASIRAEVMVGGFSNTESWLFFDSGFTDGLALTSRAQDAPRWIIRDATTGAKVDQLVLPYAPASSTDPTIDAINNNTVDNSNAMVRMLSDDRFVVAARCFGNQGANVFHRFADDAETWISPEEAAMKVNTNGIYRLVVALFSWNGSALTCEWQRQIAAGISFGSQFRGLLVDEANDAIYVQGLSANGLNQTHPIDVFYPGPDTGYSSKAFYAAGQRAGFTARLNLSTGAGEWQSPVESDQTAGSNVDSLGIYDTGDHIISVYRCNTAGNINYPHHHIMHSDVHGYAPAARVDLERGNATIRAVAVQYDKTNGAVFDMWYISDTPEDSAVGDYTVTVAAVTTKTEGVGAGVSADDLCFPVDIFGAEAGSCWNMDLQTGENCNGTISGRNPFNFAVTDGYRNAKGLQVGNPTARLTGGPIGSMNIDEQRIDMATGDYFTWPAFSSPVTQNTRLLYVFKLNALNAVNFLFDQGTSNASERWLLYVASDGSVNFTADSADVKYVSSPASTVTTGVWYWLIADINGASTQFELSTGATWSGDPDTNSFNRMRIGANSSGTQGAEMDWFFAGLTKQLTLTEVKAYAQNRWPTL